MNIEKLNQFVALYEELETMGYIEFEIRNSKDENISFKFCADKRNGQAWCEVFSVIMDDYAGKVNENLILRDIDLGHGVKAFLSAYSDHI